MSDLSNAEWIAAQQKAFGERLGAARAFWPEFQRALRDLLAEEPFASHVHLSGGAEEPDVLMLSAGLFDLKVGCDTLSDTVFYAFTSSVLKKLLPLESAIFVQGRVKLTRGYWGVIDMPGPEIVHTFIAEPQGVEQLPLADRFARWCLEHLMGGYETINVLAQKHEEKIKRNGSEDNGENKDNENGQRGDNGL